MEQRTLAGGIAEPDLPAYTVPAPPGVGCRGADRAGLVDRKSSESSLRGRGEPQQAPRGGCGQSGEEPGAHTLVHGDLPFTYVFVRCSARPRCRVAKDWDWF